MTAGTKESRPAGKGISITVVVAMFLHLAGIVWFASAMNSRIDVNAASIERNREARISADLKIDDLYDAIAEQNVVNARLDVTMQNVNRTLESVNRHMESGND